jgi:hypothetical protein
MMPQSPLGQFYTPPSGARSTTTHAPFAALGDPTRLPDLERVVAARQLFWENSVREMLTGLSVMQMSGKHPELFDGRFAVLTNSGERIGIAEVWPMFACGLTTSDADKAASIAVECSVFRIRTPDGEVFTLPLREMRGLHTLTPELMAALERQAMDRAERESEKRAEGSGTPFGFAAFTPPPPIHGPKETGKAAEAP